MYSHPELADILVHCTYSPAFMDEAQFTKDGIQNFQEQHLWADENPRAILP
jgi:hypothetical protein